MTYKLKLMPAAAVALGLLTGPALAQDKVLTIAGSGGAVKDATEQIFFASLHRSDRLEHQVRRGRKQHHAGSRDNAEGGQHAV